MATIKYYNGNQGINFLRDLFDYDIVSASETEFVLQYDPSTSGTFLEYRSAWQYKLTVVDVETDIPDDPNIEMDDVDFTAGTITRVQAYDMNGDEIFDMNGLNASLPLIGNFANSDEGWAALQYIYSGAHTITGSGNGGNTNDGWDGDNIRTGWGNDVVNAGRGDDFIEDRGGSDTYNGGKGTDTVTYQNWFFDPHLATQGVDVDLNAGTAVGPDGHTDTLIKIESIRGSFLDDIMRGTSGDNRFMGMQGDDTINGRGGFDILDYRRDEDQGGRFGVRADLGQGTVRDGFHDDDTVIKMEGIRGTDFKDIMKGSSSDNYLEGRGGEDTLKFVGGNDVGVGGSGADNFYFYGNSYGDDTIRDFEDGSDIIKISKAADFAALTIVQDDTATVIQWNGNTITLENTTATDITSDDFLF